jgi:uncharacterized membrane protein
MAVTRKRHLAKTITWRCVASLDTILISWFITGSWKLGASIGLIEVISKMFLYYFHERAWYRTSWGVRIEKDDSDA